jgi:hypothetical protein
MGLIKHLSPVTIFYAKGLMDAGMVVGDESYHGNVPVVAPVHLISLCYKQIRGIAMQDVVDLDLSKEMVPEGKVLIGSRIEVLSNGIVKYNFLDSMELPINQPLYVDFQTSLLTWKCYGNSVGKVLSRADSDGFTKIKVVF